MKLFYYITSLLICQVLFSSFFKFFRDVRCRFLCSNSFIISLLFQFVKYFFSFFSFFKSSFLWYLGFRFLASAFLLYHFQTSLSIPFPELFFRSRQLLFPESRQASFSSSYLRSRSTALSLYHFLTGLSRKILNGLFLFFCECFTNSHEHIILFGAISFLFFNCMQQKLPPIKPHMSTIFRLAHKLVKQLHFGY